MQNILFGLQVISVSFQGNGGSKSTVSIYEDGTIQYDRFSFHSKAPISSVKVEKDSRFVKRIQKVLTKYKKDIERIPFCVNNNSCDGACYTFIFYDKAISIDNPHRWNTGALISLFQLKPGYFKPTPRNERERLLAYYNNTLLDIQNEISAILARYDLPLLRYKKN